MSDKKTGKQKALHRVKIIQGHLRAIEKMLEEDRYCVEIIHQSVAIQKALKRLDMALIEDHLSCCVVGQIKSGQADKAREELLALYEMK